MNDMLVLKNYNSIFGKEAVKMKNIKKAKMSVTCFVLLLALAGFADIQGMVSAENTAGDVNLDGTVTAADMVAMAQYFLGSLELSDKFKTNMDLNGDGEVNIIDYVMLNSKLIEGY